MLWGTCEPFQGTPEISGEGNQSKPGLPACQVGGGKGGISSLNDLERLGILGDVWVSQMAQGKKAEKIPDTQSAFRKQRLCSTWYFIFKASLCINWQRQRGT